MRLKKLLVRAGALSVRPADRLVLLALLGFADHRTHECFPTQDSLAVLTGQARSTVIASTRRLEAAGLLSRIQDSTTRAYTYRLVDTWADENPNRVIAQQTRARVDEDPTRAGYTAGRSKRARVLPGQLSLHLPAPELTWGASEFVDVPSETRTTTVVAATNQQRGRSGLPQEITVRIHTESPLTPPATRGDGDQGSWIFERSAQSAVQESAQPEALARVNPNPRRENRRQATKGEVSLTDTGSCKPAKVIARLPFTPQQLGEVFAKHAPERSVLTGPLERRLERRLGYVILDLVRAGFGLDDVALTAQRYEKGDMPFVRGVLGWSSLSTAGRLRDMVALAQKEQAKARVSARPTTAPRRIDPQPTPEDRAHLLEMARAWRTQGAFAGPHSVDSMRAGIGVGPPEARTTA